MTHEAAVRKGHRGRRSFKPRLLGIGLAALAALAAWAVLVWAAIDFGQAGHGGQSSAWWYLALASLGAVACLFLALMLVTVLLRAFGVIAEKKPHRH